MQAAYTSFSSQVFHSKEKNYVNEGEKQTCLIEDM